MHGNPIKSIVLHSELPVTRNFCVSVRKTIARNTIFNALGRVWEALLGLILMAYIVDQLGWDGYGIWSFVALFTGYVALLDFGVSSAFTKYVAEYAAKKDHRAVSAVVTTGLAFYLLLGTAIIAAGWPAVDLLIDGAYGLVNLLQPSEGVAPPATEDIEDARFLFRGALILFVFGNCINALTALQSGLQRMGVTNILSFIASLIKLGATIAFLEAGFGIKGLLYTNGVVLGFFAVASTLIAFRLFPELRIGAGYLDRDILAQLFHFGWRSQVAKLSNLINFQTDRAIVWLLLVDHNAVGIYRAGEELAAKIRNLPGLLVTALVPAVSDLDARNREVDLALLYHRATKYMAALTIPITLFFLASADTLLRAIFGAMEGLDTAALVARILIVGYAANLLPAPGVSIALGKGRAEMPMCAGLISMVANIVLTIILVWSIGFYGIPIATAASLALSTTWFFFAMRKHINVAPIKLLCGATEWPLLASAPGLLCCIAVEHYVRDITDRGSNFGALLVATVLFGVTYIAFLRLLPFFDKVDVAFFEDTLHLGKVPGFALLTKNARHV